MPVVSPPLHALWAVIPVHSFLPIPVPAPDAGLCHHDNPNSDLDPGTKTSQSLLSRRGITTCASEAQILVQPLPPQGQGLPLWLLLLMMAVTVRTTRSVRGIVIWASSA